MHILKRTIALILIPIGLYALGQSLTMSNSDLLPIEHPASTTLAEDRLINIVFFSPRAADSEKITRLESGQMINLLNNQLTLNMKLFKDKIENLIFKFE